MQVCPGLSTGGLGDNPYVSQHHNTNENIQKESTLHSDEGIGGNGDGGTDNKVRRAAEGIFSTNGEE